LLFKKLKIKKPTTHAATATRSEEGKVACARLEMEQLLRNNIREKKNLATRPDRSKNWILSAILTNHPTQRL
jgi:hypothetical protein